MRAEATSSAANNAGQGRCRLLLRAEDRVLRGFGHAEFNGLLGWDLDGLALLGTELHSHRAGRSIHQDQLAETRQREGILGLLIRQLGDQVEGFNGLFLGYADLLSDGGGDL